uniref:Uncharacterized protein n=1 Tax=Timema shepardi TaxID=629360 RepID=A0A7R9G092_TIMSH|nr:unnamed protein product [Timema shepardi]
MKEVRFLPAIVVWHDDSTYEYLSLQQDDNQTSSDVPSKPIDLEKLFTPASDSGEITPSRNRKMYSSSSFYSSNLHPTLEDQVDLARKISHSLSDISNQQSKGQSMYVNRKKKSVKWIHEVMVLVCLWLVASASPLSHQLTSQPRRNNTSFSE